jgi:rare lipoprotein A
VDKIDKRWSRFIIFVSLFIYLIEPSFAYPLGSSEIIYAMQAPQEQATASKKSFSGNISWYGIPFNGKKTASGEIFDMNKLTAAHLKLPFGTRVLVEDPKTGNTVVVKVNDRGPYVKTRVMDLAKEGARQLGTLNRGIAYVDCLILTN